ncbi:hypothetical protein H5T51_03375 [Candidatus Bathyarchaeota archaeon]|nr:hypothetical protein [Candidatus Bathyarchaeota archaeon]
MNFDVSMPIALFIVTCASLILNEKVESRLKAVFEEREFTGRDAVLLVALMGIMITLISLGSKYGFISPLMVLFLFSYSMLLYVFAYIFTDEHKIAALFPPALFIMLYILLRDTVIWDLCLVNVYAIIFAVLITLYLGGLFSWKATWIFAGLITLLDIIMVFVTGAMVEAAEAGVALKLPIVVSLPMLPAFSGFISLGLGDFFLAGLLSLQLLKKYGFKSALISASTVALAFFIFELYFLNYGPQYFPATLIVIMGWLPPALLSILKSKQS